ncbi:MAG: hypothetical protein WDW36_004640 [Sanguina aurantia]
MYVVDSLLLPPGCPSPSGRATPAAPIQGRANDYPSLAAAFRDMPQLSMFRQALRACGLDRMLTGLPFPVTILAPTNKAAPTMAVRGRRGRPAVTRSKAVRGRRGRRAVTRSKAVRGRRGRRAVTRSKAVRGRRGRRAVTRSRRQPVCCAPDRGGDTERATVAPNDVGERCAVAGRTATSAPEPDTARRLRLLSAPA